MRREPQYADTPSSIGNNNTQYIIPLYQRLFAWDTETVTGLMTDLMKAYDDFLENDRKGFPYYIGLITSTVNDELVDGQQRFTVLMFIGLVLENYHNDWRRFLMVNDGPRLYFKAREKDNAYLSALLNDKSLLKRVLSGGGDEHGKEHQMMNDALSAIHQSLNNRPEEYLRGFSEYVFKNTAFFVSRLPYKDSNALNSYFESLNSTGKNLEAHEVLKVELLNTLINEDDRTKYCYALIWNAVADMDTPIIRKRTNEDTGSFIRRFNEAILATQTPSSLKVCDLFKGEQGLSLINDFHKNALEKKGIESNVGYDTILSIDESDTEPAKVRFAPDTYRSMLRFSEFLLHVLYLVKDGISEEQINKNDFFETNNLTSTFRYYGKGIAAAYFISSLLKYRILYDYFVIRIASSGDKYSLVMRENDQPTEEDTEMKRRVVQFESFQYVFSSKKTYYKWLCPLLRNFSSASVSTSFKSLLDFLITNDNDLHPKTLLEHEDAFKYDQGVDRYWFWRIDYYLWQNREQFFADGGEVCSHFDDMGNVRNCVDKYTFKRNRSIEHVAAQHPVKTDGTSAEPYEHLHDFGNLVMISSGLNSTLRNSSYEEKRGHIETCLKKDSAGIESLSMLLLYMKDRKSWTEDDIIKRSKWMFDFLKGTYKESALTAPNVPFSAPIGAK